jgi:hypothetical protein
MTPEQLPPLPERLRSASGGYDEWRVQDPKDGSYCIAYSWPDSHFPEREARGWLADHKRRFHDSQYAGYEVACVRVVPQKDRLLIEAADEITALRAEMDAMRRDAEAMARALEHFEAQGSDKTEALRKYRAAINAAMKETP